MNSNTKEQKQKIQLKTISASVSNVKDKFKQLEKLSKRVSKEKLILFSDIHACESVYSVLGGYDLVKFNEMFDEETLRKSVEIRKSEFDRTAVFLKEKSVCHCIKACSMRVRFWGVV